MTDYPGEMRNNLELIAVWRSAQQAAEENGLRLYRWQTAVSSRKTITKYRLVAGGHPRAEQARYQAGVVAEEDITGTEWGVSSANNRFGAALCRLRDIAQEVAP